MTRKREYQLGEFLGPQEDFESLVERAIQASLQDAKIQAERFPDNLINNTVGTYAVLFAKNIITLAELQEAVYCYNEYVKSSGYEQAVVDIAQLPKKYSNFLAGVSLPIEDEGE